MSQQSEVSNRKHRLRIGSDLLLLVEGQDEVHLFNALIRNCLGDETDIQIVSAGGISKFATNLKAIQVELQMRPTFRSFGIVRDSDNNPTGAFESVCFHLRKTGFEPPKSQGVFSSASPSVGVFIVPDKSECGAIETLCRRSVGDTAAAQCVEQYLKCLAQYNAMESTNEDKSFAHAYLAATSEPVARVGEGAQRGVWNFDSPAFQGLLGFVRDLSLKDKREPV